MEDVREEALREVASSAGGRVVPPADAYRAWGSGSSPSRPTPVLSDRAFIQVGEIPGRAHGCSRFSAQPPIRKGPLRRWMLK